VRAGTYPLRHEALAVSRLREDRGEGVGIPAAARSAHRESLVSRLRAAASIAAGMAEEADPAGLLPRDFSGLL
jgi:hypothetical protein